MNKINFLSNLPLSKMSGKEKILSLIYFFTDGKIENNTGVKIIKKEWPKTQFKRLYNPCQLYHAQKENWIKSNNGMIQITEVGINHIKYLQNPLKNKKKISNASLFSVELTDKLKKDFKVEFEDLEHNFGCSGTCTAFLLRKILEKLIFLVFSKHGIQDKIEDINKPGFLVGLEKMIDIASKEKINNKHIILPKTASELKGIKFLGDTAAHNPLVNVKMETIVPQMPFIITAYEELSNNL
jgi:hypothetical protein